MSTNQKLVDWKNFNSLQSRLSGRTLEYILDCETMRGPIVWIEIREFNACIKLKHVIHMVSETTGRMVNNQSTDDYDVLLSMANFEIHVWDDGTISFDPADNPLDTSYVALAQTPAIHMVDLP